MRRLVLSMLVSEFSAVTRASRLGAPAYIQSVKSRQISSDKKKAKTPIGKLDDKWSGEKEEMTPENVPKAKLQQIEEDAYKPFQNSTNPNTGEIGGPKGPEPTRYGDWQIKGRVIDF